MKQILITLLFFSSLYSFAQRVAFYDTFDDDKNGWTYDKENFKVYVEKGNLFLENNTESASKWMLINSDIVDADKVDFDIEATITLLNSKTETGTFGLVWAGYPDNSNYRVFQLSANQKLQQYHYFSADFHYDKKWEDSKFISAKGQQNKIKITKRANITKFYLNDNLVFQTGNNSYYGQKNGFILDAGVHICVEELKVTEYPLSLINVVDSYDSNLKIEKLPDFINTNEFTEKNPVIAPDGKTLYFARENSPENLDGLKEDIWFSTKDKDNKWTLAKNIGRPLNNKSYNFVISSSPDNNVLLLANKYNIDGINPNGAGVSMAMRTATGWEIPIDVKIENEINTNEYVAYYLTNDSKYLLSSVERPEGLGQKDIYVSYWKDDNSWSKPQSLGNVINTFDDETNPFLAADGKTLYFASRGHKGYGSRDIFVSKRLDDSWQNWSEPKNFGNIVNTPSDELGLFLAAKGDKAYLSRGGDLYEMNNSEKIDPVILVKGKVYDSKTMKTLSVPIAYYNLKNNNNLGTAISSPSDGSYNIVLPYGELYSFMGRKDGYYAITQNVDLKNLKEYKEIEVDLYLNPIEKGEIIRLNNIFFDSGKYNLLSESFAELDKLVAILKSNAKMKIVIAGHTDAIGSDADNLILSKNRANAVMNYLLQKSISKERMQAKGYGETKFIAKNETEEGKQKNRRVEFEILEL